MMKILTTAVVLSVSALVSMPAYAMSEKMTNAQLDQVVAGWVPNCGVNFVCGNNGWGDGWDLTNPGSFIGATAPSKGTNGLVDGGGINSNPTTSDGR